MLLLFPAVASFFLFLLLPMLAVVDQSFRIFEPGRIGATAEALLTTENYTQLMLPVYARYFIQTYLLAFCAAAIAILVAFPIAYCVARRASPLVRKAAISALIGLMFLSSLVRVYSIDLTFGTVGIFARIVSAAGINTNSYLYIDFVVIAGLLHYAVPLSILVLIGAIQNLNPRLAEAAQSLGASAAKAHITITLPLCIRGLLSAFLVSMTVGVSAFVIPLILGRGRVLFVSNLIYSRFGEVANYQSGAAISIIMLIFSLLLIFVMSTIGTSFDRQ
ncbi:ABC transporter permease [Mesorhizobium sp. M0074]|uniref:ABC transporter permease n=1 Tax=Mesorhizobium sp. M0074 TaxID=2956869 RepID=UPI003337FBAC